MTSAEPTPAQVIARRLRQAESPELMVEIDDAIAAAEADVEGYLGRPILPLTKVAANCWPVLGGWDIPGETARIREIVSVVAETYDPGDGVLVETGTFTITYTVGLDYLIDPELRPIRRYVQAAAMNDPMLLQWLASSGARGPVTSVSVSTEGQSKNVSYGPLAVGGGGAAGQDSPGALPSKTSMDRWRLANRRVHQAPDRPYDARLYGTGGRYRDNDGFWNNA